MNDFLEILPYEFCPKCGGIMHYSKALVSTAVAGCDDLGGDAATMSVGGSGKLIDCMKCSECGHSVTC